MPGLPRLVLVASRQAILLTARGVAVGSSLNRRRSALSSPRVVSRVLRALSQPVGRQCPSSLLTSVNFINGKLTKQRLEPSLTLEEEEKFTG